LGGTNDNIGLERVEDGLGYFIVTIQGDLRPRLKVGRENVHHTVRLIVSVLKTFAVADHEQLTDLWAPIH